jgi:hypothetical protein
MQQLTKHSLAVSEPAGYPRVIEVGYRFSKDFDGINPPRLVNTVVAILEGRNRAPKDTIEVELINSTNGSKEVKELMGKRFVVGEKASRRGGKPLFMCGSDAKIQFALPVVLALLGSEELSEVVSTLILSLPDADGAKELFGALAQDSQRLKQVVSGKHVFRWNGLLITRQIDEVDCAYEGEGVRDWGIWHGLVPADSGLLVVDLGGKTANLVPLDEEGEVIPEHHISFDSGGTLNLANRIAQDDDFRARFGSGYRLEEIMHSIHKANEFAAIYGEEIEPQLGTGYNAIGFKDVFVRHREAWVDDIFGKLDSRLKDHWSLFGRGIFVGGSANLLLHRLEGQDFFVVAPDAQTAHIKGLMLRYAPTLARVWVTQND